MEFIDRTNKSGLFQVQKYNEKTVAVKARYNFDLNLLNIMCSFVLSSNQNIKRIHMSNLNYLLDSIDMSIYTNEPEKLKRIDFIRKGLEARLYKDIKNPTLILAYINDGIIGERVDTSTFVELSNTELEYLNECISGAIKGLFIEPDMETFYELYIKYKSLDVKDRASMLPEIEQFFALTHAKFRKAQTESMFEQSFSLEPEEFENNVSDIYDKLTASNRFLLTGMQGFNAMVGGAFEMTRIYLLFGVGGVGKSLVMLNLALQIKRHNKGYITNDPTKKPAMIFLTQENSVEETVERLFKIVKNDKIRNYSKQEVINILKTEGNLTIDEYDNINLFIIYRPDSSISTSDLYDIIEDYEDRGYEIIAVFQDHIKRIRSMYRQPDKRQELGAVVNELKAIAQAKNLVMISVSHLNREAVSKIDNAALAVSNGNCTARDVSKSLNRADIGESLLMYDNADSVIFLNKENDSEGNIYMGFSGFKLRNELVPIKFFYQPFTAPDSIELVDDLYTAPAFVETLIPQSLISPNKRKEIVEKQQMQQERVKDIRDLENGPGLTGKKYGINNLENIIKKENNNEGLFGKDKFNIENSNLVTKRKPKEEKLVRQFVTFYQAPPVVVINSASIKEQPKQFVTFK